MKNPLDGLKTRGFELEAAIFLARASAIAYADNPQPWAERQGFTEAASFDHRNIQGFWTAGDGVALIAFRGTSNLGQWLRDARIVPASHPWGDVHAGFREGLRAVESLLREFEPAATNKPVAVAGSSAKN